MHDNQLTKIENIRKTLIRTVEKTGLSSKATLEISQELDVMINEVQKLKMNGNAGGART